jgi:hypothetical protein
MTTAPTNTGSIPVPKTVVHPPKAWSNYCNLHGWLHATSSTFYSRLYNVHATHLLTSRIDKTRFSRSGSFLWKQRPRLSDFHDRFTFLWNTKAASSDVNKTTVHCIMSIRDHPSLKNNCSCLSEPVLAFVHTVPQWQQGLISRASLPSSASNRQFQRHLRDVTRKLILILLAINLALPGWSEDWPSSSLVPFYYSTQF